MTKGRAAYLLICGSILIFCAVIMTLYSSYWWKPGFAAISGATGLSMIIYTAVKMEWIN